MKSESVKIKILSIGQAGVGKSSLITRFVEDSFSPQYVSTIGIDFKVRTIEVDGVKNTLQIWDTAGQERFRTITTAFYRGAHAAIVVYDVADYASWESTQYWIDMCRQHCVSGVPIFMAANKCDKEEQGDVIALGRKRADEEGAKFHEVSAKTGNGVTELFHDAVREARKYIAQQDNETDERKSIHIDETLSEKEEKSCCN